MNGDRIIRAGAIGSVLMVAAIAAIVSFLHIEHLAITHGQPATDALLLPVSVDGTVTAASLAMLHAARNGRTSSRVARCMLGLGIVATLAANVSYGLPSGVVGALISGWPAAAFAGLVEVTASMIRPGSSRRELPPQRQQASAGPGEIAAWEMLARSARTGEPVSQRQLAARCGVSRFRAGMLAREFAAQPSTSGAQAA